MILSLFQTASGSLHFPSILMASSFIIASIVTGTFIYLQLVANRSERMNAFDKEQKQIQEIKNTREELNGARAEITELKEKTKLLPLKKRLIMFLDDLDNQIIPALRSGTTKFEGNLLTHKLAELQKLSSEPEASKYITLTIKPNEVVITTLGTASIVMFELKPTLIQ